MEYMGIDSRNKLKEKGLTDEVIDKYFGLMLNMGNGKATYGLVILYQKQQKNPHTSQELHG